jgi:hypothetical protein
MKEKPPPQPNGEVKMPRKPLFKSQVPPENIECLPKEGAESSRIEVVCPDDKGRDGCGNTFFALVSKPDDTPEDAERTLCWCPKCGHELVLYWADYCAVAISGRGPGFHSTKMGMRRKRDMIARSERLAKSQWDHHKPQSVEDPSKIRNPTAGGPLDPNSVFNKHKKTGTTITSLPGNRKKKTK